MQIPTCLRPTTRPTLAELEMACQKRHHRTLGNWMARHVSRPAALRITWLLLPWPISANAVTLSAAGLAIAAAFALGCGGPLGWLAGACLLQAWYLLDHVDGQLARWHRTASLDGVALDYWMHHLVQALLPMALGWQLAAITQHPRWQLAGIAWGLSALLRQLQDDVCYKAFIQRLKCLSGELRVLGGGGGRPAPAASLPRSTWKLASFLAHKSQEVHVVMNTLTVWTCLRWLWPTSEWAVLMIYVSGMSCISLALLAKAVNGFLTGHRVEREFAAWFHLPPGAARCDQAGWWVIKVEPDAHCKTARAHADDHDRALTAIG